MSDSFLIGAYWGSRPESAVLISNKVFLTLQGLEEVDFQFSTWYDQGWSKKQALEKHILIEREHIKDLILRSVRKNELASGEFAKYGFSLIFWTGHKNIESSKISFNVGMALDSPNLNNNVLIKIPYVGESNERLLKINKAINIIRLLVKIWEPDYAVLTSNNLRDRLNVDNNIGWITYRKIMNSLPEIPDKVLYD